MSAIPPCGVILTGMLAGHWGLSLAFLEESTQSVGQGRQYLATLSTQHAVKRAHGGKAERRRQALVDEIARLA
jgi:hypothetical protein